MKAVLKFLGLLVLGFLIISTVLWLFMGGPESLARRHHFERLVKTADHTSIARAAIDIVMQTTNQTLYSDTTYYALKLSNLPPAIAQTEPSYVAVLPDRLQIEFHGGFDHYGFTVWKRDQEWELTWYTEGGEHRILGIPIEQKTTANKGLLRTGAPQTVRQSAEP